jgi:hypothetical protein
MSTKTMTTRRAILAGGAAAATLPAAALAVPLAPPDPIFAAIEAHRTAMTTFNAVVDAQSELRSSTREYEALGGPLDRAYDAQHDAALALLSVAPTTITGAVALLRYANEYTETESGDDMWPDHPVTDDDDARPWAFFLHAHVADALEQIAAAGGVA